MKKKCLLLTLSVSFLLATSILQASASKLSPAFDVISCNSNISINGIVGNDIKLSKDIMKELLDCKVLSKIIITELPDNACGTLKLNNHPVSIGDTITSKDMSSLVFTPNIKQNTSFSFDVFSSGIEYNVNCDINILEALNFSPIITAEASANLNFSTYQNVCFNSKLYACDPEGDEIIYEITKYPQKGIIQLTDSGKGTFRYTPTLNSSGKDSFSFVAVDVHGNRSLPAEMIININELKNQPVYADLYQHPAQYAATVLSERGIFTGEKINDKTFFYPDKVVSRGEFLTLAMSFAKISPSNNTSTTCDEISDITKLDEQLKDYVLCGKKLGYLDGIQLTNGYLQATAPINFAEAATIINRICNHTINTEHFVFAPNTSIPTWAYTAVSLLSNSIPEITIPEDVINTPLNRGQCVQLIIESLMDKYK